MSTSTSTTTESRALALLGQGIPPSAVASALGVDPSRISQLLSDSSFAAAVVEKKFESLIAQTGRDTQIDSLEDKLLEQLKFALPMMTRPMEIVKAYSVINAAKRRGVGSTESVTTKQTVVPLQLPTIILQQFTKNVHNQVIQVGEQSLLTIQSGTLLKKVEAHNDAERTRILENNASPSISHRVAEDAVSKPAQQEQRASSHNVA